uniref:Uncharacterized protein n=1 Tax=Nymphaea colorata TaxID=210225 RepID=A0A5K1AJ24_9MAGN
MAKLPMGIWPELEEEEQRDEEKAGMNH